MRAEAAQALDYPMPKWVFDDAAGRYDIDLGDSHVACGTTDDLVVPSGLELSYGIDRGVSALTERVAARYGSTASRVVATHGAQEALYLLYCVLLRPGDQVVAFTPGWRQAIEAPRRLGCRLDVVALADDFSLDLAALEAVAGPDLRLITINTPCNPTGRRLRPHELRAVTDLAARTGAYIVLDEEYVLDLSQSPAVGADRIVSVSSVSKIYGLPGLRVGWIFGPEELVTACAEYKHLTTISNSVLCEMLAVQVLDRYDEYAERYHRLTRDGLAVLVDWVGRHQEMVSLVPPEGTPFAWCFLNTGESSMSFARRVLDRGVLIMPGETLGTSGGFRLSFARETDQLAEGLRRIGAALYAAASEATRTHE
jgi:aspartate/methionine/tyrosine aminotransferase